MARVGTSQKGRRAARCYSGQQGGPHVLGLAVTEVARATALKRRKKSVSQGFRYQKWNTQSSKHCNPHLYVQTLWFK